MKQKFDGINLPKFTSEQKSSLNALFLVLLMNAHEKK